MKIASTIITCVLNFIILIKADVTMPVGRNRNIHKPPGETDVSQIRNNTTPWILDDLVPTILQFKDNTFTELKSSEQVRKIWNMTINSQDTRSVYFKVLNRFLTQIEHPAPSALSNILSKFASLFDPLDATTFFEIDAINFAEFLLSRHLPTDRSVSKRYVDILSGKLAKADMGSLESVIQATLDGYVGFIESFGFNIRDVIDELFELYASEVIVQHDK